MAERRSDRVESLFHQALDLPPGERQAFLDQHCASDSQLRAELEALIGHEEDAPDGFLEGNRVPALHAEGQRLADQPIQPDHVDRGIGEQFGQYRVVRLIGAGGMGAVYEAEQENPRRRVALKVLRYAAAMPQIVKRFQREAHLLARLQHPCIAHIYEAGIAETSHGPQPFFAMEYIDGRPLDAWATQGDRTIAERLEMISQICDAVHHAHVCGVIHRDLKPGNILVDADDRPRILDFGIARATEADVHAVTLQTEVGQLMGTVPYMSPEQVVGNSLDIDARSDVYSLGVLLYEVLAGRLPLDVRARSIPEAARIIREEDPSHLSLINSAYRGDVDTIVAKSLEKDANRRYQTAAQLADDIRRYLHDKPITARPVSTFYQLRKFAQRNKALVAVVALAFVMLSAATVLTARFAFSEAHLKERALEEQERSRRAAYRSHLLAAQMALQTNDVISARRALENVDPSHRNTWEWKHLFANLDYSDHVLTGHGSQLTSMDFSPDGSLLATADNEGAVRLWRFASLAPMGELIRHGHGIVRLAFLPDGDRIVSASTDGELRITRVETGEQLRSFGFKKERLVSMDVSPDGRRLMSMHEQHVRLWDVASGEQLESMQLEEITADRRVCFATDGIGAIHGGHRELLIRRPALGGLRAEHRGTLDYAPTDIDASHDGRTVVTGCRDKTVVLWDATTLEPLHRILEHGGPVNAVAFDPTDRWVASGSDDCTVRIWNSESGRLITLLAGHVDRVTSVAISPDGQFLASGSADRTIRIWRIGDGRFRGARRVYEGHTNYVYDVSFDPEDVTGMRVMSAAWDGTLHHWHTGTGETIRVDQVDPQRVPCAAFNSDGKWIAAGASSTAVKLLDARTGEPRQEFDLERSNAHSVAFSPDSRYLAASRAEGFQDPPLGAAFVWDIAAGKELARYDDPGRYLVFSSPQRLCVAELKPDTARIMDAVSGKVLFAIDRDAARINRLRFSPDESRLITASDDGDVEIWDAQSGDRIAVLSKHTDKAYDARYSPDGRRIATCSNDNTIRIWDAHTFDDLLELRGHNRYVYALAFSPDGSMLVSASGDHTLRVWDTLPLRKRNPAE